MKDMKTRVVILFALCVVTVIFCSSILLQFKTVEKNNSANIERLRTTELQSQISTYTTKYEEAKKQYDDNQNKILEYTNSIAANDKNTHLLEKEYEETEELLGLTDVKGEGVKITLQNTLENSYTANDIRNLINELKYAGAEAISINDNRIINLTDIVTLNMSFIVMYGGNVRLTAPYVIKAIGDKTDLSSTLKAKNTGYADLMQSRKLKITVEESEDITINKYQGDIESNYMKEVVAE